MNVLGMKMLIWMSGVTIGDRKRNENVKGSILVIKENIL